jgi:hypothetical protein
VPDLPKSFFYYTAPGGVGDQDQPGTHRHFWRYYDAATKQIHDNCLVIAGLLPVRPIRRE